MPKTLLADTEVMFIQDNSDRVCDIDMLQSCDGNVVAYCLHVLQISSATLKMKVMYVLIYYLKLYRNLF